MGEREQEAMPPEGGKPKSFLAFLAEQDSGMVVEELSEDLRNATEAVENHVATYHGKATAELTVKVKLTLERGVYKVSVEHATKLPKAPASSTMMWLGVDGNLGQNNPKQMSMPFATVGRGAA